MILFVALLGKPSPAHEAAQGRQAGRGRGKIFSFPIFGVPPPRILEPPISPHLIASGPPSPPQPTQTPLLPAGLGASSAGQPRSSSAPRPQRHPGPTAAILRPTPPPCPPALPQRRIPSAKGGGVSRCQAGPPASLRPHLLRDGGVSSGAAAAPRVAGPGRRRLGLHVPVEERGPLSAAAAAQRRHLGSKRWGGGRRGRRRRGGAVSPLTTRPPPAATRSGRRGKGKKEEGKENRGIRSERLPGGYTSHPGRDVTQSRRQRACPSGRHRETP